MPAIPVQTGMMQDYRNELALLKEAVRKIQWNECHRDHRKFWQEQEHDRYSGIPLITGRAGMRAYGMAKALRSFSVT